MSPQGNWKFADKFLQSSFDFASVVDEASGYWVGLWLLIAFRDLENGGPYYNRNDSAFPADNFLDTTGEGLIREELVVDF